MYRIVTVKGGIVRLSGCNQRGVWVVQTKSTLPPGDYEEKQLYEQYSEQLTRVRYRYDERL